MKPNNLVALLVVVILLAIGIALAVINNRSESNLPKPDISVLFKHFGNQPIHNAANLS